MCNLATLLTRDDHHSRIKPGGEEWEDLLVHIPVTHGNSPMVTLSLSDCYEFLSVHPEGF